MLPELHIGGLYYSDLQEVRTAIVVQNHCHAPCFKDNNLASHANDVIKLEAASFRQWCMPAHDGWPTHDMLEAHDTPHIVLECDLVTSIGCTCSVLHCQHVKGDAI